jgi:hypothetical protein
MDTYYFQNDMDLLEHQYRELYQMKLMETSSYTVENKTISTNFGVLGSKCGSGKTVSILALIQSTFKKGNIRNITETNGCEVATVTTHSNPNIRVCETTLIIVPNYLLSHWETELVKFGITYSVEQIKPDYEDQVCLLPSNAFNRFYLNNMNVNFKRIIVDEADTIRIPNERYLNNHFIWFVSGMSNTLFYEQKFRNRTRPLYMRYFGAFKNTWMKKNYIIVETDEAVLLRTIRRNKPIKSEYIDCITKFETDIRLTPVTRQYINTKKYNVALISMGFDFIEDTNIDSLKDKTDTILFKNIKERTDNIKNETCVICYDNFRDSYVINKCCGNLFCSECICKIMKSIYTECPYCRKGNLDLILVGNKEISKLNDELKIIPERLLYKEEQLAKIIHNSKDKKFLVLSIWDYEFIAINDELKKYNITSRVLSGRVDRLAKKHKNGDVDVLLVNERCFAPGITMPWVTDLVIFTQQSNILQDYFINKILSNRPDNMPDLCIHYLTSNNEIDYN